ncbi:Baculoviral IAP repeat-containing protein bir-2 [Caenorhabditis elegans]|uniref:Baculoviral IAP repeat-containing protein bir-2 n=1 Tax=Caenorhabditis elegans TaxID=6239 RepID=BIR2_CAEEL|nr:Baculoviral IAP repeat-containing protein bir-2 [Caenorhabditis elegans]G5ECJ5.1 RecName: Full=Baculoviral IAP repeat-containing protein bir-2 [Caenorhabditis elegans]AAD00182.1 inhibitor of apoptosis homolog [Caenorhabditis elegans]CAB01130.1 Baculoviral IAP repeat-containing protein bir-2 [Caenorhabditis elegans]|eukprot:NP_506362.1 Baculoviral IAP repeat-containing protein bir-2 [Caenorhabditis elegans]
MPYTFENSEALLKNLKDAAPYISAAERFASFKGFVYDKRINIACTSEKLARAGFYSTASPEFPASAKCPFCMLEINFEQCDDPWEKHKSGSPHCEFVMIGEIEESELSFRIISNLAIRHATVRLYEELLGIVATLENGDIANENPITRADATRKLISFRSSSKLLTFDHRLATFQNFIFDKKRNVKCTSKKLAKAGWFSIANKKDKTSAKCPFCLVELDFDESDDPWEEHQKFSASCDFIKLGKLDEKKWTENEALMLGARITIMQKYEKGSWLIDELEKENRIDEIIKIRKIMIKPNHVLKRRRCSI